jgi:hypothetical protein
MAADLQSAGSLFGDIAGFGLQAYGAFGASSAAKDVAGAQTQIAGLEMQADQQRRTAMEINARRSMTQNIRSAQVARSLALSAGVNQGAQFSSSVQAGEQGAASQGAYANLGTSQNLQLGEKLFDINSDIDSAKIAESNAKAKEAEAQAIGGLGKGLGTVFGDIGKMAMFI